MKELLKLLLILVCISLFSIKDSYSSNGHFSSNSHFNGKSIITLSQKWIIIPDDKPYYKNYDLLNTPTRFFLIDHNFSWTENDELRLYNGNAWYRTNIIIRNIDNYALLLPIQYRGAQIYLNGEYVSETRPFSKFGSTPKMIGKPEYVPLPQKILRKGKNLLAIRTGALNDSGGFNGKVEIGPIKTIKYKWIQSLIWNIFLVAINFYLSIYYILFYLQRKEEGYNLFFSGLSFSAGMFVAGYRGVILWIFDSQIFYYICTYLGAVLTPVMLLCFIHSFFKQKTSLITKFVIISSIITFAFIIVEYSLKGELFYFHKYFFKLFIQLSACAFLYATYITIKACQKGKDYSGKILTAMIVLTVSLLVGSIHYMMLLPIPDITPEGYFLMTIIFASALASRFARVHTDLEAAHGDLKVLDKMKDEFLATTSHELRTPLHGIIGLTDAMLDTTDRPLAERHRQDVQLIQQSARRLNSLVDEILDFSRLRAERVDLFLSDIDLKKIIPSVASIVQGMVGKKNVSLDHKIDPDVPVITGDRNRLEQVLLNLLSNGVKFTDAGAVVIAAQGNDRGVMIAVRDTGRGMDHNELKRIWNPYEQGEEAERRTGEGTGLGLAITKYLIELHGGTIDVESEKGSGTIFTLFLPFEPPGEVNAIRRDRLEDAERLPSLVMPPEIEQSELERELENKLNGSEPQAKTAGGEYIMVIDDDPVNCQIIKRLLAKEGYRIEIYDNGKDALAAMEHELPHLILLDLMLPEMSGYDIMLVLRQKYKDIFLPVIMVTARSQMENMVKGFIFGCNDYLTKPFNAREMVVRVQNQLVMKNVFDTERSLRQGITTGENIDEHSLVQRSRLFRDAVDTLKEWELVISKDLNMSKAFLERLMGVRFNDSSFDCHVHYDPLLAIGGDVYLVHQLDDGRIRLFLADATGHGINASLNSISIMSEYNLMRNIEKSPAELLFMLNNRFLQMDKEQHIVFTCCIVDVYPDSEKLVFASAGHPPQVLVTPHKKVEQLQARGVIIGMARDVPYENSEKDFVPGSKLLLFTDGLTENYTEVTSERREAHDEEYLYKIIEEMKTPASMRSYCNEILARMKGKGRRKRQEDDDLTMISLYFRAGSKK